MIRYNVYITKTQEEELRQLSKNGISVSEHIRRAISEYTHKHLQQSVSYTPSKKEPHV